MRTIEIRRHSYTKKGAGRGKGSHLSAEGVAFARTIGATMGTFDLVLTSHIPRTLETAIAMGFAVDDQREALGDIPADVVEEIGHHDRWVWEEPFVMFAHAVARNGATARMGQRQRTVWVQALDLVPSNGRVLVVSHGRVIEAGLVTCLPRADFAAWGAPLQHCEGVELHYDTGQFVGIRFFRRNDSPAAHLSLLVSLGRAHGDSPTLGTYGLAGICGGCSWTSALPIDVRR